MLDKIKELLLQDKIKEAERELLLSIYSTQGILAWKGALKEANSESKLPQLLAYASKVTFDRELATANIDFRTKIIKIGVKFFLEYINSWADVVFILLHERNHVLINYFYKTKMKEFKTFKFGNFWEDIYINNLILESVNSDLCARYFSTKEENNFHQLANQHEIVVWLKDFYIKNQIKVEQSNFNVFLLNISKIKEEDHNKFIISIYGYSFWMNFGIFVENLLKPDQEEIPDDLTEINIQPEGGEGQDKEDQEETINEEIIKTKVQNSELPDHIKELLNIKIEEDNFQIFQKDLNKYKEIITTKVIGPLLADRIGEDCYQVKNYYPESISRKDLFSLSRGVIPLSWDKNIYPPQENKRIPLYMDTSSSMTPWYPLIPQMIKELNGFCYPVFHFDTIVIPIEDPFGNYIYNSTYGTNYNTTAKHIIDNGFISAIVLSDSTESILEGHLKKLENQLKQFVYITIGKKDCGFKKLVTRLGDRGKVINLVDSES